MAGPVRRERVMDGAARMRQLGAEFVEQRGPRRLYYLRSYGLYAVVQPNADGGTWIGYFQDRNSCGC